MQDKKIEIWKPLMIPEVLGLYTISNYGNIKSLPRYKHTPHGNYYLSKEKLLKQTVTNTGYLLVTLSNKPFNSSFLVHILTGLHFVDNPNNHQFINHDNGIKTDNYFENLNWCTRSQNMLHAFSTGLISRTRKKKSPIVNTTGLQTNCL